MARFFRYQLRTTDAPGASAFYAAVLGRADAEIFPLHEAALARGARPHWLGSIDVAELEAGVAAFVAHGGKTLGPSWVTPEGRKGQYVRDAGGAFLALAQPVTPPVGPAPGPEVVWQVLTTLEVERAKATYGELFGWEFQDVLELPGLGAFHRFAWQPGGAAVGALGDISERPSVHPQWLFHFGVAALEPAVQAVRAGGGLSLEPIALPNGDLVAVCDDPQGAAFALYEKRS